jgi:segregation and condensation protein B
MHKKIIEAALFTSTKPLMIDDIAKLVGLNSLGFVKQIMEEMQKEYDGRGLEIVNTPEGWTMQVKQELLPRVAHLTPYHDISEGSKRTLALITYKEPVKQSELIKIQGNKTYSYIKDLVKKGLVKAEKEGRTKLLFLTPEFEKYFGQEKEKVKEQLQAQHQQYEQELEKQKQETQEPEKKEEPIDDEFI